MTLQLLGQWTFAPILVVLVATGVLAVWAGTRHPRRPARATWATLAGLSTVAVAVGSGIDARAEALLSVHMVQHMLLGLVAAPLLVAGAPVRLALGTLGRRGRHALARGLRTPVVRTLSHPLSGLVVFAGTLAVVHVPTVYGAALAHPGLHAAEHAALLWSALALWAPVIAADPLPHRSGVVLRVSVVIGATVAMNALGALLVSAREVVYPAYRASSLALGRDPLGDQALAGGLMWVGGMALVLPLLLVVAWQGLIGEERRQQIREAHADAREAPAQRREAHADARETHAGRRGAAG